MAISSPDFILIISARLVRRVTDCVSGVNGRAVPGRLIGVSKEDKEPIVLRGVSAGPNPVDLGRSGMANLGGVLVEDMESG